MAEATLAVAFPTPYEGMAVDEVDRRALEHERLAVPATGSRGTRRLARLGRAVDGLEIRIVDPVTGRADGRARGGRARGSAGNSVTPGYYRRPELDAVTFRGGWLRTGDLGYLVDGELVVCGRMKDVIIVGGRNVFPEDVERAVAEVDGVRAGNVIAFGVERRHGREGIVVVAETRDVDVLTVREAVANRVRDAVGLPTEVVLVAPGTPAQDLVRQAPALAVSQPLPGAGARAGVTGREGGEKPPATVGDRGKRAFRRRGSRPASRASSASVVS